MSDILLATKIHVPPLHASLVHRPRLIQRLNDGFAAGRRLTLISAPAGYGKSTLVSEWVSQLGSPVAWLSLESAENTPSRFWNYFAAALSSVPHLGQAGIAETLAQAWQPSRPPSGNEWLASLANALSRLPERTVLVLDDLHAISESEIHQEMVFLIDHLAPAAGLHLVVTSRMDPPWPLARWRAREELNELRPADLRFSYAETVQYLNQLLQFTLSAQEISALQERTEGWITGLRLAALSMQGRMKAQGAPGVARFVATFTGSNRFILDYLVEEVVIQQPVEIQAFLQDTSILEQLTAPLCNALLGRQDSQALLDQVEQANLFLDPLDEERRWYRYHQLFADILHKRLEQMQPGRVAMLHQRASQWYAGHNFLPEAISHALDSGDVLRVNELVSGNALATLEHAELLDVLRQFEALPAQEISAKPWLGVAYAWVKAYVDPSRGLDEIIRQAEQGLIGVENPLEHQRLGSHIAAIRAYAAWMKGEAVQALELAAPALKHPPENDWLIYTHLLNTVGLAWQYLGNLPEATQSFEGAVSAGQKTGRYYEYFNAYTNLAFVRLIQGQLRQAFSLCQHVLKLAQEAVQGSKPIPVLAYAYATMSLVQLEWNEVEASLASARESVALAEQWEQVDALHFSLTCLSKALRAAGDLEEAAAVNRRAMALAVNVSTWFYRISACEEVLLHLAKGELSRAARIFNEIEPQAVEGVKKAGPLFAQASLLNRQGRFTDTLTALEEPISKLEQQGDYSLLLSLLPLLALALQAVGREEESLTALARCLALSEAEGYVRIYVEQGAPMARLLQLALKRGITTAAIHRLLPAFNLPGASQTPGAPGISKTQPGLPGAGLTEPLSEAELKVLRLLDSRLTVPEIARQMVVAPSTIRTHVRNIYGKLNVHGRIEANQKAKDLGLI